MWHLTSDVLHNKYTYTYDIWCTLYTGSVGITWNVYYLWLYLSYCFANSHIYKHIHTITYITSTSSYVPGSKLLILGMTILSTLLMVENFGPGMAKADLWESTMAWSVAKRTTAWNCRRHREDKITTGMMKWHQQKKTSCIFFQGIDSRFFEKKLRFLDFNYFRFQKSGRVSRNFGDISDLWMDFLKFYPIYFHEPWAMANANFSRIKGKMCATNKYPSMSLINQSFSNDFNFWF